MSNCPAYWVKNENESPFQLEGRFFVVPKSDGSTINRSLLYSEELEHPQVQCVDKYSFVWKANDILQFIRVYFQTFLSGQVQMLSIYSAHFHIYILKAIAN